MTSAFVPPAPTDQPELFFALVGPMGTDLDHVTSALAAELSIVGYTLQDAIRLSQVVHGLQPYGHLHDLHAPEDERLKAYMKAGDEVREGLRHGGALAALAVHEVRRRRGHQGIRPATAYLFRSLKHPKEIEVLRAIYGSSLIVISVYDSEERRAQSLAHRIERTRGSSEGALETARTLINADQEDSANLDFGQSVRKTFPLADFFLDAGGNLRNQIERLVHLLFGHPHMSPSRGEYAMFMAQAAALRSSDMSRQVGAVIVDEDGEIVAAGCNEVPKPGGGVYWSGDEPDHRDFNHGSDPNAIIGREILQEVFSQLKNAKWLASGKAEETPAALVEEARRMQLFEHARVGNLIEFGRVVHAEMNALMHAARQGLRVRDRWLYCTTFPCHGCARHIIGSGIARVVYIEPYPKSLAFKLYSEAVAPGATGKEIVFAAFTGVAPRRYLDFFGFGRRKDPHGYAVKWVPLHARPRTRPLGSPYLLAEQDLCDNLLKVLKDLSWI